MAPKFQSKKTTAKQEKAMQPPSVKYCQNCGRLISPNHRNFAERKYCSKYCSSNRLNQDDRNLEQLIVQHAHDRGQISCDEMQIMYEQEEGRRSAAAIRDAGTSSAGHSDDGSDGLDKQKEGMVHAKWRERVRRAARRVVTQGREGEAFECVQDGEMVEPSYAKGDWSVRFVRR